MLIAFEGLDQSGKETQSRHLRARLEQDDHRVRSVSFPDYETPIGIEITQALAGDREFRPDVLQLLYIANRLEYKPRLDAWLEAGEIVICDRYRASSVAYGEAQGVDPAWLDDVQRVLPAPDVTVLLDISPATAVSRKKAGRDRFERDLGLLERVRESYSRQAAAQDWIVVDGEQTKDDVGDAIVTATLPRLGRRSRRRRA
jgi:dTMP kinase